MGKLKINKHSLAVSHTSVIQTTMIDYFQQIIIQYLSNCNLIY